MSDIVGQLFDLAGTTHWILTRPANFRYTYLQGGIPESIWNEMMGESERRRKIQQLRREKKLKDRAKGGEIEFRLHKDEVIRTLRQRIRLSRKLLQDPKCLIVCFDVPEVASKARTALRRFLIQSGFAQNQLSVYVTKKDIENDMRLLVRLLELQKWVSLYKGHEISP